MTTHWRAAVAYASSPTPITDEQADMLMANLPGYGIAVHDGDRIRLEMTVTASTLRKATDEALKAAAVAYAAAFDVVGQPIALEVITETDHQLRLTNPRPMQLAGIAEIADMGTATHPQGNKMSRQQAQNLTRRPDFPAPIAELSATKVYTGRSVEEFFKRWPRKAGWAGKIDRPETAST